MAVDEPYSPAVQLVHAAAEPRLKVPTGHVTDVALVEPGPQAYPGAHAPAHCDDTCAALSPYRPGSHGPVQLALNSPLVLPYSPAAQSWHDDPPTEYLPAVHDDGVDDVEPSAQM